MKILKKITVKTVLGRKVDRFDDKAKMGASRVVMTVWGRADRAEHGANTLPNGDTSEYIKFRGEFKAHENEPGKDAGEECFSTVCIMPDVASGLLAGILNREGMTSVNFAFSIAIQKTDTTVGYEYVAKPLFKMDEQADPLDQIYQAAVKALPAPKKKNGNGNGGKAKTPATAAAAPAGK